MAETQPTGYGDGGEDAGSTGGVDTVDDVISAIPLLAGDESINNDFDETRSSISGTVFQDDNNDGDPTGETGIGGVTLTLTGLDDSGAQVTATTTTDPADGSYSFDGLLSGDYTVTETQPGSHLDGIDDAGDQGGDDTTVNDQISAIALPAGIDAPNYDFGEVLPASIAGTVVDDESAPIGGVTISLTGTDDLGAQVTASTTTDAVDGTYLFDDLRPGTYTVTETQPVGYGDGGETAGSAGGLDAVDDVISGITLIASAESVDNDFDEVTASVTGTVFEDLNNDGDPTEEPGIGDVVVTLVGTDDRGQLVLLSTTTEPDGTYGFEGLLSGTYALSEEQPEGYFDGLDEAGTEGGDTTLNDAVSQIVLPPGAEAIAYNFGETEISDISGVVEADLDSDGVPDSPLDGVVVNLVDDNGDTADTMTTGPDGSYVFEDVPPGDYTIVEADPTGYQSVSDVVGDNDNVVAVTMISDDITNQDFLDEPLADISGTVEEDLTGDGLPNGPIEGVMVGLFNQDGNAVSTVTTAPDGSYFFEDVPPGAYTIVEIDPTDHESVSDVAGDNDNMIPVTMSGESITNQDFVDEPVADISGIVEKDTTQDGVPDGPLEGVVVNLVGANGDLVDTTTTGPDGSYLFEDVSPGEYRIVEAEPEGYGPVSDVVGDNDNTIPLKMSGEDITGQDFVDQRVATISGTVEQDQTGDNMPDAPIEGVVLTLIDDEGNVVATTTTGSDGAYLFESIPFGDYVIQQSDLEGFRSVSDILGDNDNEVSINLSGDDIVGQDFVDGPLSQPLGGMVSFGTTVAGGGTCSSAQGGHPITLYEVDANSSNALPEGVSASANAEPGDLVRVAAGDLNVFDSRGSTENPVRTDSDGSYGWTLFPGSYVVELTMTGRVNKRSEVVVVPPEQTAVDFVVACALATTNTVPPATAAVVTPPPVTPAVTAVEDDVPSVLALTGGSPVATVLTGVLLVLSGMVLVFGTRRRRQEN